MYPRLASNHPQKVEENPSKDGGAIKMTSLIFFKSNNPFPKKVAPLNNFDAKLIHSPKSEGNLSENGSGIKATIR